MNSLPEVKLISKHPRSTESKDLKIEVKALDSSNILSYLRVDINNVPMFGMEKLPIKNAKEVS